MINIAIIEDLPDVVEMLKIIINNEADMQCIYTYSNAEDAMHFVPLHDIDVMIIDIGLPRASGIDALKHFMIHCPKMQHCMFTVYEDDDKIFNSIKSGAKGYILKSASKEKIVEAVRELYNGGSPMTPSIARRILQEFNNRPQIFSTNNLPLTAHEKGMLSLLSKGLLYKEIGNELGITTGTVKQHIHRIYHKLHVNNKIEAINRLNG